MLPAKVQDHPQKQTADVNTIPTLQCWHCEIRHWCGKFNC